MFAREDLIKERFQSATKKASYIVNIETGVIDAN